MKMCSKCGQAKPESDFYKWSRICRNCKKEYRKEYRARPEVKEYNKEHRKEYYARPEVKEYRARPEVKEYKKEYNKEYYKKYYARPEVKEHKKEYNKEYYARPEVKEYRARPEVKEYKKEYYKEYYKKYYARPEVKEHRKEHRKEYYARPEAKEKKRIRKHNHRSKKKNNGGVFTKQQWEIVKRMYDYKCAYCGEKKKLTIDHIVPVSKGGKNDMENIIPACFSCNASKRDRTPDEWIIGNLANL